MIELKNFIHIKNAKLIIAGGDGTVASVINHVKSLDWNPPIAILPLGTGNDLSRALGWVIYVKYTRVEHMNNWMHHIYY